ncbi:oligosaccharide flippase family protein, partial [Vibrio parahaemolyticus]|nr:oligosaccharide flippase family protein [Vibrio parahaemolyticus]
VLKKDYKELKVRFTSLEKVKPIILESFPEMLAGLFGILFMKMDQLLISYYYGKYELGIYTAATRLTEAWYFIPTAILAVVLPKINRIKIDKGDYTSAIESSISILVFIAIIVSIFFNLFSDLIVQVIFGEEYFSSSKIIVIHVWSSVFLCMGLASGTYLILEGKLKYSLYRNLLGVITSFAFGLVLIPKLGIEGAAYSTLAGMVSAFFIFDVFVRELRGLFIFKLKSLFVYKAISFLYSYLRLR